MEKMGSSTYHVCPRMSLEISRNPAQGEPDPLATFRPTSTSSYSSSLKALDFHLGSDSFPTLLKTPSDKKSSVSIIQNLSSISLTSPQRQVENEIAHSIQPSLPAVRRTKEAVRSHFTSPRDR